MHTSSPPLTRGWKRAIKTVGALVAALGLIGFGNSFVAVADAVAGSFAWPWTVPLGIDVAIAIFSGADIIMARLDMRTWWLRHVSRVLVVTTIYLNVATETSPVGRVAHTALPALWVAAVEIGTHAVRVRANLANPARRERIPRERWALAPLATPVMWRRMVLWGVPSYTEALDREQDRILTLAWLEETYGKRWRRKAPPAVLAAHRLGRLNPRLMVEGPTVRLEPGFRGTALDAPPSAHAPALVHAPVQPGASALHLVHPGAAPGVHPGPPPPGERRRALAKLLAELPADDPRNHSELARDLGPRVGLTEGSARNAIRDWAKADTAKEAAR